MTVAALLFRLVLVAVFLQVGAVKVLDLVEFRLAVSNYQLVPGVLGLVGRTSQHASREVLIEGDPLPVRLLTSRSAKSDW